LKDKPTNHDDSPGTTPKGVEMKTRLGSTILSRIQPRPDIHIRVLTHDTDPTKEIAILRVSEGAHPPYMHNKGDEHRIYVRTGAQKAEADYLQLNALYDKRTHTLHPATGPSMHHAVASIANDVARAAGTVLGPSFDQFANAFIKIALQALAQP
jgi:hypothetical protein